MSTRVINRRTRKLLVALLAIASSSAVIAADAPSAGPQGAPSKEMRAKMATVHERMAACLRSDKPINDCRAQMMKSCQEMMGDQCPMMGMMGMGQAGMGMHGGQMPNQSQNAEPKK